MVDREADKYNACIVKSNDCLMTHRPQWVSKLKVLPHVSKSKAGRYIYMYDYSQSSNADPRLGKIVHAESNLF